MKAATKRQLKATGSQSIERAAAVLRIVSSATDGLRLSEIVQRSGLNKATVHRLLAAMKREGLIEQDESERRYFVGLEILALAAPAAERFGIGKLAADALMRITSISNDTAFFSVRRGAESVCLQRQEGSFPIRVLVLVVGERHPLGVGSGSLAMLAALPDADVEEVLRINAGRIRLEYPNYNAEMFRELVAQTRSRGYSLNKGMLVPGSWGIGAAIRDPFGRPIAAVSVAAIENRMSEARQQELGTLIVEEAQRISASLRGTDRRISGTSRRAAG